MLSEQPFTRENLDQYLKELAKEFRKRTGKSVPAEIILIGGALVPAVNKSDDYCRRIAAKDTKR